MAVDDLRKHNSLNCKFRDSIVMCTTRLHIPVVLVLKQHCSKFMYVSITIETRLYNSCNSITSLLNS